MPTVNQVVCDSVLRVWNAIWFIISPPELLGMMTEL